MEPEGSLQHSQVPVTRPYPEPDLSCPCHHIPLHIMLRAIQKVPGPVLILPPTSRLINSTLCYLVQLCVYEQTAIISLNCANRVCHYCGDTVCLLSGITQISFMRWRWLCPWLRRLVPVFYHGDPGSTPSQSMWNWWCFGFPLWVSFHKFSIFILIYMLLLSEGQIGGTWEPSKKQCCVGIVGNRAALGKILLLSVYVLNV